MQYCQIFPNKSQKGFTLIELLVAISIIATLTAILLPNFMGAREKAKDAQKKADMVSLKNALRLYYNDNQSYPTNQTALNGAIPTYAPQMNSIGYTYTYTSTNTNEGFQLCVGLDSVVGTEVSESRTKCASGGTVCGVAVGSAPDGLYVVCAN